MTTINYTFLHSLRLMAIELDNACIEIQIDSDGNHKIQIAAALIAHFTVWTKRQIIFFIVFKLIKLITMIAEPRDSKKM